MCRFAAYLGKPLLINAVVSGTRDSLITQSLAAKESAIKVNADGFGIGWYQPDISNTPAVFVSILPAWSDVNLKNISHLITSSCFFGHVRAADEGPVSIENCHPFNYQNYLFMHNGNIGGFKKIKLEIFKLLEEKYFLNIKGNTDSETFFALWLNFYEKTSQDITGMVQAWQQAVATIENLQSQFKVTESSYINAVVTDGYQMSALRYTTQADDFLSLYYTAGKCFMHRESGFSMQAVEDSEPIETVLIASERMTSHHGWIEIPGQHLLTVNSEKIVEIRPLV